MRRVPLAMAERRAGPDDQQLAQVAVAHLGDAPEPLLAAARPLARRQAEQGGELAAGGESARMSWTVATIAEAVIGPIPGIVVSRRAVSSAFTSALISSSIAAISRVDRVDLTNQRRQGLAHAIGNDDFAVLVGAVGERGA